MSSKEIVKRDTPLVPQTLSQVEALAAQLARSGLVPEALRNKPHDLAAILITGIELGLGPMASIRGIHVIKGRVSLSAQLLVGLCHQHEACRYFRMVQSDESAATFETHREGDPEPTRLTWTMEQAKKAGSVKGDSGWAKYPAEMLRARCSAALARAVYPDAVLGLYLPDESQEASGDERPMVEASEVTIEAVPVTRGEDRAPALPLEQLKALLSSAPSLEKLNALAAECGKQGDEEKPKLREIFQKRKKDLEEQAEKAKEREQARKENPDIYRDLINGLIQAKDQQNKEYFETVAFAIREARHNHALPLEQTRDLIALVALHRQQWAGQGENIQIFPEDVLVAQGQAPAVLEAQPIWETETAESKPVERPSIDAVVLERAQLHEYKGEPKPNPECVRCGAFGPTTSPDEVCPGKKS